MNCFASPEFQQRLCQQSLSLLTYSAENLQNNSSGRSCKETIILRGHDASLPADDVRPKQTPSVSRSTSSASVVNTASHSSKGLSRRHTIASTLSMQSARPTSNPATPKWRPAGSTSSISSPNSSSQCRGDGTSCIPRPADLVVSRRVGVDGVVIAWSPLDHDCVSGFQVVVAGKVVQLVKSPHRTKALVTGLPMTSPCTIGLISVGIDGRCSKPAVVTCDRSSVYPNRRRPTATNAPCRKMSVPTCI